MTIEDTGAPAPDELLPPANPPELQPDEGQQQDQTDPPVGDPAAPSPEGEEGEGDKPQPPPKPKKTTQERIHELTWRAREAERQRDELLSRISQPQQQQPPAPKAAQGEPDPTQYEYGDTDANYIHDLAVWTTLQTVKAETQRQEAERVMRERRQSWEAKAAEARKVHDDFDEIVMSNRWDCSDIMADAIASSDVGADIAYHLANNPAEARRISQLSPVAQALSIGRLESQFSTPASPPQPKTVSNAPPPAPQVRAANGKYAPNLDTCSFEDFEKYADKVRSS